MKKSLFLCLSFLIFGIAAHAQAANSQVMQQIISIADQSSCIRYSWEDRGRAPAGYIEGMAVVYAKSMCRGMDPNDGPYQVMDQRATGNSSKDAVTWFEPEFSDLNMSVESTGHDTLRALFTLGIGLGMRESSGDYSEGWDTTAHQTSSASAEAGLFQTSYDAITASEQLSTLYSQYKADSSKCYLNIFAKGSTIHNQSIYGTGEGATFQKLSKSCPAFAAEFAMTNLRVDRRHYGPLNRKEAEVKSSCNAMLKVVQTYYETNPQVVCAGL